MDYSIFPPINASLNGLSTILLIVGFLLIKSGKREAHKKVMIGALVSSAVFLVCYLTYHYGAGHTEFPKEYPTARKVYFAILIPHIILAVVNLPFIIMLLVAALRGRFEKHKKIARYTFPSWLFVSVTGVIVYFMIYQWFPPTEEKKETGKVIRPTITEVVETSHGLEEDSNKPKILEAREKIGELVFTPVLQAVKADPGQEEVTVTFRVENVGQKPVDITKLESGCACLSVSIDVDPIPARESATITGVFDTSKMRGTSDRKITLVSDQSPRSVLLTTRIEIAPIYLIEPPMTKWEIHSDVETKTVDFRVLRKEPIRVLNAESKRKEVSCELETVEAGRHYRLKLTPDSTESSMLGIVRMETDCEIEQHARPLAYFSIQ